MRVTTYQLDGSTDTISDLERDRHRNCWIDGQEVLATSVWDGFVALTLVNRLVLIRIVDYERLTGYSCSWVTNR